MNGQRLGWVFVGVVLMAGGCKTESGGGANNGVAGQGVPLAGVGGVAGTGAAGMGVAGTGAAGMGVAGMGAAGMGAAGMGAAGMGAAGMGAAGMGAAGMGAAGMGGGDVQACIDMATAEGRTGACPECGCMKCLDAVNNCADEACKMIVACGQDAGCKGRECYCGTAALLDCAIGNPNGPCVSVIEMASGLVAAGTCSANMCASALSMLATTDPDNPVQRANQLSVCTRGQDFAAAIPGLTEEQPEIPGMCETECTPE